MLLIVVVKYVCMFVYTRRTGLIIQYATRFKGVIRDNGPRCRRTHYKGMLPFN